jgi:acetyltransferase-like isoleucine patch superfamily enzyme
LEHRLAAIGPDDRPARRFGSFGSGTCISWPTGYVFGERWIHLGEDTLVGSHVTLSAGMVPGQQMVTDPVVRIGDRCLIGRGSAIVGHLSIDIGDDVFTGMNVYITDQNHGYEDLDMPIGTQLPSEDPVVIGADSWIGSGAVILPGARIGRHVVVGANSVVRGEIPDYSVVVGSPGRVVRRHDGTAWQRGGEAT